MKTRLLTLTACLCSIASVCAGGVVTPSSTPAQFAPAEGQTGNAYQPKAGPPLVYPLSLLDAGAGTVAFWVRVDESTGTLTNVPLVSSGAPPGTWLYIHLNEGRLGVVFQRGARPFTGVGEFYVNTSVDVADWQPGTWHHVALAWAAAGPGESALALFVDGDEREARFNLSLAAGSPIETITVGANSASVNSVGTGVAIDDLRVWNLPLGAATLKELLGGGSPEESALVLHANFDEGYDANAHAELSADLSNPAAVVSRLRP